MSNGRQEARDSERVEEKTSGAEPQDGDGQLAGESGSGSEKYDTVVSEVNGNVCSSVRRLSARSCDSRPTSCVLATVAQIIRNFYRNTKHEFVNTSIWYI